MMPKQLRVWVLVVVSLLLLSTNSEGWSPSSENSKPKMGSPSRRNLLERATATLFVVGASSVVTSPEPVQAASQEILVFPSGDVKKIFNEGRALESQGNMAAAQRLYGKVTNMEPRFVYGWANLGNTQTAFGDLPAAEASYSTAIQLCQEIEANLPDPNSWTANKCSDLYVLHLNRGSLRLNTGRPREALQDLQLAASLRARPDAIVLQNLARAKELNGLYLQADRDYTTAISMTAGEVAPFWLRSVLVKYQIGDTKSAMDLMKRINQRFPEAPEVRAAYATLLYATGDENGARLKFLEIPDRQRLQFVDNQYLTKTVSWPPVMRETLGVLTKAVGDSA